VADVELLVLAGGFGTRLRSAVPDLPKPLAPVLGRPYLSYQLESWLRQGVTSLTFLLHHQAEAIETFLASQSHETLRARCAVRTVTEPRALGTGGAIGYAVRELQLTGSFLVTNADTWLAGGIGAISRAQPPSIGVVQVADVERYGTVRFGTDGTIAAFEEKGANAGAGWINAGLYHLPASLFRDWDGQPLALERDVFPRLAQQGQVRAVSLQAEFIDIGVPADYFRFCSWVESGKVAAAAP
jgi:D-glycero-alpha-D-manno-heptose 1-phosphate guanylyltransferase